MKTFKRKNNSPTLLIALIHGLFLINSFANAAFLDSSDFKNESIFPYSDFSIDNSTILVPLVQKQNLKKIGKKYSLVFELIRNKKLHEAQIEIDALIKDNPGDPELFNLLAILDGVKKKSTSAIASALKAIELDHTNLRAHLLLSNLNLEIGNFAEAIRYAEKSIDLAPRNIEIYFLRAFIAAKQNHQNEAEQWLLEAQKQIEGEFKKEFAVAQNLGKFYFAQKRLDKIVPIAERMAKRYPYENSALLFLANAHILNKQLEAAQEVLRKLISREDYNIQYRVLLAKVTFVQPGGAEKAIGILDEALSKNPDSRDLLIQKINFLTKLKKFSEALEISENLKKRFLNEGIGDIFIGDVYLSQNKLDQAKSAYKQSYEKNSNPNTLKAIVNIMRLQGQLNEAIDFIEKELKQNNENYMARFNLALVYEKLNNLQEAEKQYQIILSKNPDNAMVLNNLAWLYFRQNNPKALMLAERAFNVRPNSPTIVDTYGEILIKNGALKKAIKIYEQSVKIMPTAYDLQYILAKAYVLDSNDDLAVEVLKRLEKKELIFSKKDESMQLLLLLKLKN